MRPPAVRLYVSIGVARDLMFAGTLAAAGYTPFCGALVPVIIQRDNHHACAV